MSHLKLTILSWATALGGAGLALAFAIESFVVLPGGADLLLITMVHERPGHWWYYVLTSSAGSVTGSLILFMIARKGGERFVDRHVTTPRGQRALAALRRYELFAIFVPSILPPPAPFKIFVLLAGATGIRPFAFVLAMSAGRVLRYSAEAWLAVMYGDAAMDYIHHNLARASLGIAGAVVLAGAIVILLRLRRRTA